MMEQFLTIILIAVMLVVVGIMVVLSVIAVGTSDVIIWLFVFVKEMIEDFL